VPVGERHVAIVALKGEEEGMTDTWLEGPRTLYWRDWREEEKVGSIGS